MPEIRRRRLNRVQFVLVGGGLAVVLVVTAAGSYAQTQDAINATVFERLVGINFRLDQLEWYLKGVIVTLLGNTVAHLVQIGSQRRESQRRDEADE